MFWFLLSFILIYIMVLSFHYQKQKIDPRVYQHQVMTLLENYIRQILKWSYMSIVEKDPLKAVSYSNYSVATLLGLKEYMKIFRIPIETIKDLIGEDLSRFQKKIMHIQKVSQNKE
jgi:hypothetical protein